MHIWFPLTVRPCLLCVDWYPLTCVEFVATDAPKDIQTDSSKNVKEGQSVTLTCSAKGSPPPNLSWFKEEELQSSKAEWNIPSINDSQSGEYYCKAENRYGKIKSNPVVINVTCEYYVFTWIHAISSTVDVTIFHHHILSYCISTSACSLLSVILTCRCSFFRLTLSTTLTFCHCIFKKCWHLLFQTCLMLRSRWLHLCR